MKVKISVIKKVYTAASLPVYDWSIEILPNWRHGDPIRKDAVTSSHGIVRG